MLSISDLSPFPSFKPWANLCALSGKPWNLRSLALGKIDRSLSTVRTVETYPRILPPANRSQFFSMQFCWIDQHCNMRVVTERNNFYLKNLKGQSWQSKATGCLKTSILCTTIFGGWSLCSTPLLLVAAQHVFKRTVKFWWNGMKWWDSSPKSSFATDMHSGCPPHMERERRRAMYARVLNLGERTVLLRKNVTVSPNCDHIAFNAELLLLPTRIIRNPLFAGELRLSWIFEDLESPFPMLRWHWFDIPLNQLLGVHAG